MNVAFVLPVALASLGGSLHCALMCGGLVAVLPRQRHAALWFHTGRGVVYAALGMAAGGAGTALDLAGQHAGLGRLAALVSGSLVLAFGLAALLASQGVRLPLPKLAGRLATRLARRAASVDRPAHRSLLLGVSMAFLPCGWLYGFVLAAAATASPLAGGAVMVAFFAGTLPSLLGVSLLVPRVVAPLRRHLPVIAALLLVGLGLFSVIHRANLPARSLSAVTGSHVAAKQTPLGNSPECH